MWSARRHLSTNTLRLPESGYWANPGYLRCMGEKIRKPAVAGRFYTDDAAELKDFLSRHVDPAGWEDGVRGIIAPHAGYVYSGVTAAKAYSKVRAQSFTRAIVIAPAHRMAFKGLSVGPHDAYETPLGKIEVDAAGRRRLLGDPLINEHEAAHAAEHSLEVQLPFIQHLSPDCKLLPILVSDISHQDIRKIADAIAREWKDDTLLVISSDFTHYGTSFGYTPFPRAEAEEKLKELDGGAIDYILAGDADGFTKYVAETKATICGRKGIAMLLKMLDLAKGPGFGADACLELVDYTSSAEKTGDYGNSVGYAAIIVRQLIPQTDRDTLMKVARDAIQAQLFGDPYEPPTSGYGPGKSMLFENGACFVTLRIDGKLRGCIGTLEAREVLIKNVAANAVSAAFHDPRFPALDNQEYRDLDYHISVLTPPKPIPSYSKIILGRHGIILRKGPCRAVYLPSVPTDQGWNLEETLTHLSRKAHLPADAWNDADYSVFETISIE